MNMDFLSPDEHIAAPMAAEGMPLSVALGNVPLQLIGEGHSAMALHSIGTQIQHIAGDMGQKVAAELSAPAAAPGAFLNAFKPV